MMSRGYERYHPPPNRLVRQESRTLNLTERQFSDEEISLSLINEEYAEKMVQESDGNFFENFTALAWKQENRRRRTASEELKESEKPPPSECNFVPRAKQNPLMKKDFELLYIEVLYTIKHKIGTTTGSHLPFIQDLYLYAREAFGVTPEDHARLLAKASEEKPPVIVLNIAVVEGRNLEAKDADGFSDPYCMLGIMPGSRIPPRERQDSTGCSSDDDQPPRSPRQPHRRTNSALKRFSQSFKRKPKERDPSVRGQLPARFIRCTSVKPNTLNPQWNEEFRCDIEDVKTDRLHLDIWDHDDESSVFDAAKKLNEIAGLKGLGRFFKQVAQSARTSSKGNVDDFLGCVNLRFDDIPSTGTDRWYDLEGRSARSNVEGQIRLKCSLSTREARGIQDEDNWTDIRQHEDLMCLFIEHEIRKYKDDVFKWRGDLPRAALTILHQHAIQGDITDMQAAMCRWQAYSKKHREHAFDWEFLYKLLTDLDELWAPDSLTGDEEENLGESLSSFILHCVSLLQRQRELYPTGNKAAQYRLNHLLKCLAVINESIIYKRCCPFHAGIINDVSNVIKKSTVDWYGKLRGYSKTQSTPNEGMKIIQRLRQYISQNDEMTITAMIDLTNILNTDMQKATETYDLMYENTLNIQYFNIVYKQTEQLLGEDVNSNLDRLNIADMLNTTPDDNDTNSTVNQQTAMQLFELYLALLEFCRFRKQLPANERRTLSVMKYYEWFNIPTKRWLDMAKSKVMKRIKTAVELDKELAQVDSGIASKVKQSTSAIDVCCCFGQVVEFWKHLEWPDQAGSYSFVVKITEDLCEGAIYYADLIHAKLKQAGYYDDVGVFDVTEQLCMTINDIEQVKKALIPLSETLKYTELIQAIDKCNGERAAKESKYALVSILKSADDDLNKKISQVIGRVADRMKPFIRKDVFHLCWAPESVPTDKAISQLLNYLDSNLITLNTHLLQANFDRILEAIWLEVVDEIDAVIDNEETKPMSFYERLYHALDILVDFFHANDKGLKMEIIRCRPYAELYMLLSLNKAPTPELIQTYYLEKMEEQDSASSHEFGMISMRVYYNTDAEILSVEVLNAKNVIPLDPNGLSDPFVLIELCPQHLFPNQTIQQTKIIKNSLNPVFDETFDFSVSLEQCMLEGACILFTVMDHDFMLANDFAGEVYLSLNTITGVNGEHVAGFSALAPACLALTQPLSSSGPGSRARGALAALESRTWDRTAVEFAKKRRQIEQQCKT